MILPPYLNNTIIEPTTVVILEPATSIFVDIVEDNLFIEEEIVDVTVDCDC
jgi:hypothetical protein